MNRRGIIDKLKAGDVQTVIDYLERNELVEPENWDILAENTIEDIAPGGAVTFDGPQPEYRVGDVQVWLRQQAAN